MHSITTNLILAQHALSYPSSIALCILMLYAWRCLRIRGFLIIAIGSVLNITTRILQGLITPFRMGHMPFTDALTLDDTSRIWVFSLIHSAYLIAALLTIAGTIAAMRGLYYHSSRRTREKQRAT